jgi:hypothetical protein
VEAIAKADSNEAETRKRIDRILGEFLGYDTFKHLTSEYEIHGAGDTVHCDIAIQLDHGEEAKPQMFIECKRVGINLRSKHVGQAASYAIKYGCEWILLTNSRDWKLYHITFGQPPQTKLIETWNLLDDDPLVSAKKFEIVSYRNVKNNGLAALWEKRNVLSARNMLKVVLSEDAIRLYQRRLNRLTGVRISPEDIVGQFRHLLNESALSEMDRIKISLPARKQRTRASKATRSKSVGTGRKEGTAEPQTDSQS